MTAVPAHALTNEEIRARIRAYKSTRDEASIRPVLAMYASRILGIARRCAGAVDVSDLESAGYLALSTALDAYDPESPVPFGAFFAKHHKAALRAEQAQLDGAFAGSRKTAQYRGYARAAAQAVARGRTAEVTGRRGTPAGDVPAYVLPATVTDNDLRALQAVDREVARAVLPTLLRQIDTYLQDATGTEEADRLARQAAAIQIVRTVLAAGLPTTRAELEASLRARVDAVIATFCRFQRFQHPDADDYWDEVGRRVRLSPENAKALVLSSQGSVSLDAPIASDGTATVAERTHASVDVDANMAQLVGLAEAIDLLPPLGQSLLVLSSGLDGQVALTVDEIALATGLAAADVRAMIGQAKQCLKQSPVQAVLRGESPAYRARADAWRAALTEALGAWSGQPPVVPDAMPDRPRVRPVACASVPPVPLAAPTAAVVQGDLFAGTGLL